MAERLAFNYQDDGLRVFVNLPEQPYYTREGISVEITLADNKGNPIEAPMSMAVVHADGIWEKQPDGSTVESHFWLSSELRGLVEQAPSYFTENGPDLVGLDLVMRTHGWRGFEWEEILDARPRPLEFQPEKGLSVGGRVFDQSGEPLSNAKVYPRGGQHSQYLSYRCGWARRLSVSQYDLFGYYPSIPTGPYPKE